MSLRIKVQIEIDESSSHDGPIIEHVHSETILPAAVDGKDVDVLAIADAVLDRLHSAALRSTREQLEQVVQLLTDVDG